MTPEGWWVSSRYIGTGGAGCAMTSAIAVAVLLLACRTPDVRSVSERYVGADAGAAGREPETVLIPAGPFLMGTDDQQAVRILGIGGEDWKEYLGWQQPQHEVFLSAYRIGRYPVTNMEYWAFVRATGHEPPRAWPGSASTNARRSSR